MNKAERSVDPRFICEHSVPSSILISVLSEPRFTHSVLPQSNFTRNGVQDNQERLLLGAENRQHHSKAL